MIKRLALSLLFTLLFAVNVNASVMYIEAADVNGDTIGAVSDAIEAYPEALTSQLESLGWLMIVTDQDLAQYSQHAEGSLIYGITDKECKHCYISTWIPDATYTKHVALHEFAHAIDFTNPMSQQEFVHNAMLEAGDKFPTSDYAITSQREFYAECWAYYYLDPVFLNSICPVMFEHCRNCELLWSGLGVNTN